MPFFNVSVLCKTGVFSSGLKRQLIIVRNFKGFITDIIKKPPMLFPMVGLFHVLWLVWIIWDDRSVLFQSIIWLQVLWLAGYTIFWIGVCDLRKWAAIGYILLTVLSISVYIAVKNHILSATYISDIFSIDVLFSFILLYYYKLFR